MHVDVARGHFLAGTGFARQHHAAVRLGHLVEVGLQRLEGGGIAQHLGRGDIAAAQFLVFAAQAAGFHRAGHHDHQLVDVERLFDEIIGTLLDRGDRDLDVAVAADDHHRHVGVVALDRLEDVDPVHPAVLQPDVQDHQRRRVGVDRGHALVGIAGQADLIAFVAQDIAHQFADVLFIVDDQNGHAFNLLARPRQPAGGHAFGPCGARRAAGGFRPWRRHGWRPRKAARPAAPACRRVPRQSS